MFDSILHTLSSVKYEPTILRLSLNHVKREEAVCIVHVILPSICVCSREEGAVTILFKELTGGRRLCA